MTEFENTHTLVLTSVGLSNLQKALQGNPDNPYAVKFLEELNKWVTYTLKKSEDEE